MARCCSIFELDTWLIRDLSRIVEGYVGESSHDTTLVKQITESALRQVTPSSGWDVDTYYECIQFLPCHGQCVLRHRFQFSCTQLSISLGQFYHTQTQPWYTHVQLIRVWKSDKTVSKHCVAICSEWMVFTGTFHCTGLVRTWKFLIRRTGNETRQQFRQRTVVCPWDYQSISICERFRGFHLFGIEQNLARFLLRLLPQQQVQS